MKNSTLIDSYLEAIKRTEMAGEALGKALLKALRAVLPYLDFSLGWAEGGSDLLCFWAYNGASRENSEGRENVLLDDVIAEAIPELASHVDTPFGIWISPKEAERVRRILQNWKNGRTTNGK